MSTMEELDCRTLAVQLTGASGRARSIQQTLRPGARREGAA
ncbi:MAG TPA: hypothetical protein VH228_09145 [Nocardioides sp.]|nr:hypothetical protein [Nocardioides sp.]